MENVRLTGMREEKIIGVKKMWFSNTLILSADL